MSDADDDAAAGYAPPPFVAEKALLQLKRALRDLKLNERGNAFELRGRRVLELAPDADAIHLRIARKPVTATPEWDKATIRSDADQRKLLDDLKKRLARWDNDE